jgi:DNA-binding winged helix-turn-helix (wHTH) protein
LPRKLEFEALSDTLTGEMTDPQSARRYRFGVFEADAATGELRRQGIRVKLNAQPFQVLLMLLERPGELLTRDEISRELWTDGTFVDYEHGVNSAVNRIREALGDSASNPRFVETLARRGYRFLAPVERISLNGHPPPPVPESAPPVPSDDSTISPKPETEPGSWILASAQELPKISHPVVQSLFVLFQLMYLAFYVGALANLPEIEELVSSLPKANAIFIIMTVTAAILIPVRAFVLTAVLFHAPRAREKLLKIWRFLLPLDELWALSPFLLLHHINFGLALSCTALLVYSPFAQRSLILMGAGGVDREISAGVR